MAALVLKLKSKTGQQVLNLNQNQTIADLKRELSSRCKINEEILYVLSGFPPKPLNLYDGSQSLLDAGISSGDTLIVEEKPDGDGVAKSAEPAKSSPLMKELENQFNARGVILRKVVPADNSCLFTSIGFVLNGKIDTDCGSFMRLLIVEHVKADPETFSEAILGKPPAEYCAWILNPDSWGGAIELSILSKYYGIEIAVVDSQNAIVNRFGEDQNYPHRVLLIFDGIHYDPLYLESLQTGEMQTIFPADDAEILAEAQLLAEESKSSKQFTDVSKFNIKCLDCRIVLVGQMAATAHAKQTGHVNFGEV